MKLKNEHHHRVSGNDYLGFSSKTTLQGFGINFFNVSDRKMTASKMAIQHVSYANNQ